MIWISTESDPDATTITVDGRLAGRNVETLDASVKEASGQSAPVYLFLRDVSSIDESGQALLARLAAAGIRLSADGLYCSYIVSKVTGSLTY